MDGNFRFSKFMSAVIPVCLLVFLAYQLVQEAGQRQQCFEKGGAVVISSNLSTVCVRLQQLEQENND